MAVDGTYSRERRAWWLLVVLLTGQFMANVDTAIVNVAAPSISTGLGASGGELELVISGYTLAYAMLLITGARLGDMRGYRRIFLIGLGAFTLASLTCGLSPNAVTLILARMVQGTGAALMVPQVLSGIQLNFTGARRARALGFYVATLSSGAVAGQILGGVLISINLFGSGWRPVFLINVPIGAVLIVAALRLLPVDRGGRGQRLDLWGVAALSATVLLAVVPLILGRELRWPGWMWACLIASFPALVAFIAVERRIAARDGYPLINLRLLTQPAISWGLLANGTATSTYFSMLFVLALYLQRGLGRSPLYSGFALVSWVAAFGLARVLLRRLPARVAPFSASAGSLILAAAYLCISGSLFTGYRDGSLLLTLLGFGGLGLGIGFSALIAHMTAAVSVRDAPDLSGLLTTTSQVSGVAGVAIFGTAYLSLAPHSGPDVAVHAFTVITASFAIMAFLASIAAYQSVRRQAPTTDTTYATSMDTDMPNSDTIDDVERFDAETGRRQAQAGTSR